MLTAWDKSRDTTLALPDFETGSALAELRERARQGDLVCPSCRQPLWLHAGEILVPHFAHRSLNNCPHGRISEAVLAGRRLLYRFFQSRIESGKLPGEVQLEPILPGLPKGIVVDLVLRRAHKPMVNVVLIESSLKPDLRRQVLSSLAQKDQLFRPVFLTSRLKRPEDEPELFLLDTTQRDFRLRSPYDMFPAAFLTVPGTLHFVDAKAAEWTTLRGLTLAHHPQAFSARKVWVSQMARLLWSEAQAEWVHEGEAEALKEFKKAAAARQRQVSDKSPPPAKPALPAPALPMPTPQALPTPPAPSAHKTVFFRPIPEPAHAINEEPEPLPAWIHEGLACVGCGQRTIDWQMAHPGTNRCVCHACFAAGVRLLIGPQNGRQLAKDG